MLKAHGSDDALLAALMDDIMRVRAEGRAARRSSPSPYDRQQLHARLAEVMGAYADAAANAGVPIPSAFRMELELHRSRAGM